VSRELRQREQRQGGGLELPKFPYLMHLSTTERNRRWRAIRRSMEENKLDCLLVWGNGTHWGRGSASLRYVSGIGANEEQGLCIFPLDGEPTVIVWHPAMAAWWSRVQNWVKDVRGRSDKGWAAVVGERMRELGLNGRVKIGLIGFRDPQSYSNYSEEGKIRELLSKAAFSEEDMLLNKIRMIKSEEEIDLLTKASRIVDAMFQSIVDNASAGVEETKVYSSVVQTLLDSGGEYPEMILWDAAKYPNLHPGRTPEPRRLRKDDVISVELHSKYCGYMGHGERCIFLSKPTKEFQRIHDITIEVADVALEHLRAGETLENLADAMTQPVKEAKLGITEMGVHGHGIASGEYPTFLHFPFHYPGSDKPIPFVLKANMVFGLTADLFDPSFHRGKTGLMYADTVIVSGRRGKKLTRLPSDLMVTAG